MQHESHTAVWPDSAPRMLSLACKNTQWLSGKVWLLGSGFEFQNGFDFSLFWIHNHGITIAMPLNVWLITDQLQNTRTERKTNNKSHCYPHHQRDSGGQVHFWQDLEPFLPLTTNLPIRLECTQCPKRHDHVILYCVLQPRPPTLLQAFPAPWTWERSQTTGNKAKMWLVGFEISYS